MNKIKFRRQRLSYYKNFIKNLLVLDFLDLKDGFLETVSFLASAFAFALHLLLLPVLAPAVFVKWFRWKRDRKFIDRMWSAYESESRSSQERLFCLTQRTEGKR